MKALAKPLFVLFALFFITLTSCTAEDLTTNDTVKTVLADTSKKDIDPPMDDPHD